MRYSKLGLNGLRYNFVSKSAPVPASFYLRKCHVSVTKISSNTLAGQTGKLHHGLAARSP